MIDSSWQADNYQVGDTARLTISSPLNSPLREANSLLFGGPGGWVGEITVDELRPARGMIDVSCEDFEASVSVKNGTLTFLSPAEHVIDGVHVGAHAVVLGMRRTSRPDS